MRRQRMIWIGLTALALLAGGRVFVGAGTAPTKKSDAPKPLPPGIVKAWQSKGAELVWTRLHEAGYLEILRDNEAKAGALPTFQFRAPRIGAGSPPKVVLDGGRTHRPARSWHAIWPLSWPNKGDGRGAQASEKPEETSDASP